MQWGYNVGSLTEWGVGAGVRADFWRGGGGVARGSSDDERLRVQPGRVVGVLLDEAVAAPRGTCGAASVGIAAGEPAAPGALVATRSMGGGRVGLGTRTDAHELASSPCQGQVGRQGTPSAPQPPQGRSCGSVRGIGSTLPARQDGCRIPRAARTPRVRRLGLRPPLGRGLAAARPRVPGAIGWCSCACLLG